MGVAVGSELAALGKQIPKCNGRSPLRGRIFSIPVRLEDGEGSYPWTEGPQQINDRAQQPFFTSRKSEMKWETPRATELRFGMEITMYIAHR
jgi:coenzyme PQQ precursor peptide PqqA